MADPYQNQDDDAKEWRSIVNTAKRNKRGVHQAKLLRTDPIVDLLLNQRDGTRGVGVNWLRHGSNVGDLWREQWGWLCGVAPFEHSANPSWGQALVVRDRVRTETKSYSARVRAKNIFRLPPTVRDMEQWNIRMPPVPIANLDKANKAWHESKSKINEMNSTDEAYEAERRSRRVTAVESVQKAYDDAITHLFDPNLGRTKGYIASAVSDEEKEEEEEEEEEEEDEDEDEEEAEDEEGAERWLKAQAELQAEEAEWRKAQADLEAERRKTFSDAEEAERRKTLKKLAEEAYDAAFALGMTDEFRKSYKDIEEENRRRWKRKQEEEAEAEVKKKEEEEERAAVEEAAEEAEDEDTFYDGLFEDLESSDDELDLDPEFK